MTNDESATKTRRLDLVEKPEAIAQGGMTPPSDELGSELNGLSTRSVTRVVVGGGRGIAGTVYGTVLVMATLVAAAPEHTGWDLTATVASASLAIWLAHVYANELGASIEHRQPVTLGALKEVANRQLPMLAAATVPTLALAAGAMGVIDEKTAVWLVLGFGLLTLGIQGLRYSRIEDLGTLGSLGVVAANLALGGLIVAIKVIAAE